MNSRKIILVVVLLILYGCTTTVYKTTKTQANDSMAYYLPKGIINLVLHRDKLGEPISFALTTKILPDENALLYLSKDHSYWYDDKYTLHTDENGLLLGVNSTNTFKGEAIIQKIGEIAGTVAQLAAKTGAPKTPTCVNDPNKDPFNIDIDIDPYKDDPAIINSSILSSKCVAISYNKPKYNLNQISVPADAILYRKKSNFNVTLSTIDGSVSKILTTPLPDASSPNLESISIDRGYFVDRDFKLTFINGMLTQNETSYPSEILGFISLPLALVKGVSEATIGRFGAHTKELQNETSYLQAIKSRDDALKAVNK